MSVGVLYCLLKAGGMLGHIWGHLRKTPYTHVLNAPKRGHMALTENAIKAAQPKDKAYRLADSGGLYLEVSPKGQKYWRFKYRFAGKEKRLSIGVYNPDRGVPISLKEARRLHNEARLLLESGIDPSQKKRMDKLSRHLSAENTFKAVAKEWYEKKMADKAETHQTRTKRLMEKDLFPYLGSRPINEILPREVLVVLHKIENRGAVDTAHRAKGVAGQIFRYGVATGRCDRDPTQDLKGALRERNKKHFAAITDPKGAGQLMLAIDRYEGGLIVKSALYLSALLFQRPGEIRHMEWVEIDWENNQWEVPKEKIKTRKKMRHNHLVPLCDQAVDALKHVHSLTGQGRYVFPGQRGASRPLSENGVRVALRTMGFDDATMTAHGFRAMARTLLAEQLEYRVDWIEHQLCHAVKDANGEAYNRTTFIKQRKEMMQHWADYLDSLKQQALSGNVITANFAL